LLKEGFAGLVVIMDDLDKMVLREYPAAGCSTQEYLFVHRGKQLRGFNCHVIYTMPIELAYSHQEQEIANLYGGRMPVIPMTRIATRPPRPRAHAPGMELFREIIRRRLASAGAKEKDVFESETVRDALIRLSGGQPTELMTLVRESLVAEGLPITDRSFERAHREGRQAYSRQLRADHRPIIEEVRRTGNVKRTKDNDAAIRELLESRAILLYINDDEWYGVNPLIDGLAPPKPKPRKRKP